MDNVKKVKKLVQLPGNQECADCGRNGKGAVRFCSVKLDVFLCNQCYAAHRALGAHITRGKCIGLDGFTAHEVELLSLVGNLNANARYEASMPPNAKPPPTPCNGCSSAACQDCKQRLRFIADKYEKKRWYRELLPTAKSSDLTAPPLRFEKAAATTGTASGTAAAATNDDPFGLFGTSYVTPASDLPKPPKQSNNEDFFASFGL